MDQCTILNQPNEIDQRLNSYNWKKIYFFVLFDCIDWNNNKLNIYMKLKKSMYIKFGYNNKE